VGSLWAQDGASQRSVLLIIANYLEALYIETGFPTSRHVSRTRWPKGAGQALLPYLIPVRLFAQLAAVSR
jgi:hypothetical protein